MNFAACLPDVKISSTSQAAGITANCGAHTITGVTNGTGQLTLSVVGNSAGGPPFAPTITGSCLAVTADGVALSNVRVATADLDGSSGVGALDISICFGDKVHFPTFARADMDNTGTVDALDISAVFGYETHLGSTASGTACP
jgi:hypothetical protein